MILLQQIRSSRQERSNRSNLISSDHSQVSRLSFFLFALPFSCVLFSLFARSVIHSLSSLLFSSRVSSSPAHLPVLAVSHLLLSLSPLSCRLFATLHSHSLSVSSHSVLLVFTLFKENCKCEGVSGRKRKGHLQIVGQQEMNKRS